ncbi:hypothetical protein WJX73_002705 [Symbiochloris irregularis]|uniref:Ribosomal RNA-processing protein 14/surfeit locus protein 6 C-terminal domain-containing protein n=1 Tax=Symbiochloris irregularis TaxID=706552 RepID=A0AAW1NSG6_9CHLO
MKKKDKKRAAEEQAAVTDDAAPSVSYATPAQHAAFFDSLIDLVPRKYYLEPDEPLLNLKHMKKAEKQAAKRQLKEEYRKNKRAKMDPSLPQTTQEWQRLREERQRTGAAGAQAEGADAEAAAAELDEGGGSRQAVPPRLQLSETNPATLDELRQRLQDRVQTMREKRKADDRQSGAKSAKAWRKNAVGKGAKQKAAAPATDAEPAEQAQAQTSSQAPGTPPQADQISFGRLHVPPDAAKLLKQKKKKKPTKKQLLEAARKAQPPAPGSQEAWDKALKKAKGVKIYDDKSRLNRDVKREQRQKKKRARQWKERNSKQRAEQKAQQTKRKDNLSARTETKMQNRRNKREAKLMRPGFEGRRSTFIS